MANNPNYENASADSATGAGAHGADSETDRLLDAATRRIGNEPDDAGSFGDFSDADQYAVRGSDDVTTGEHGATPAQYERSTDGVGVEDTDRLER